MQALFRLLLAARLAACLAIIAPAALARAAAVLGLALLAAGAHAQALTICGSIENHYGPYDYRSQRDRLHIVEKFHFTPRVEALIRGESSDYVGDDLSYTLATSPNHHRALVALVLFGERTKSIQPPHMTYTIECYFDRAIRFRPDDSVVRTLFGRYLGKQGKRDAAIRQLQEASRLAADNGFSHYNLGLVYLELGIYDHANAEARLAREWGFERPDLEEQLKKAGQWQEPPPKQASPESARQAASEPASEAPKQGTQEPSRATVKP